MRVDSDTSHLGMSERRQVFTADRSSTPSISTTQTAAGDKGVKQADFTSMTRQEIRD